MILFEHSYFTLSILLYFPEGVKVYSILAGKTNNCDKEFITTLGKKIEILAEVATVEESNIVLVFCPIVSRTGTDIEAALNNFNCSTGSLIITLF